MNRRPGRTERSDHSVSREPVRVDAAIVETRQLLELVRREETALRRMKEAVTELIAISSARRRLANVTNTELAEATDVDQQHTSDQWGVAGGSAALR